MTEPYTPSLNYAREMYASAFIRADHEDALAEFDRMIEAVRAEAWHEGWEAGTSDGRWDDSTPNPYRVGKQERDEPQGR